MVVPWKSVKKSCCSELCCKSYLTVSSAHNSARTSFHKVFCRTKLKAFACILPHTVAQNGRQMANDSLQPQTGKNDPFVWASSTHPRWIFQYRHNNTNYRAKTHNQARQADGVELGDTHSPSWFPPYLPTQGRVLLKALSSKDMSMDHVFHISEVYQVLPIPAQMKGKRVMSKGNLGKKNLLVAK